MPFDQARQPGPQGGGSGERAINLPAVILWLIGINIAIHVIRTYFLSDDFDQRLIMQFGLVPSSYTGDADSTGADFLTLLAAPIAYQFLHANWLHVGVNMVTLAAFGAPVERVLGPRRFVAFYLCAGIFAGFVHVLFFYDKMDPVIGASGAISGLFGAVLILMQRVGRMPSLLPIAVVWIGLNVFFGVIGGAPGTGGEPVAWTAHIGGFVFGLLAVRWFIPRQPV
jgi:membrane associated rhomboid family serine protease